MCARPLLTDVLIDGVVGFFILVYTHTRQTRPPDRPPVYNQRIVACGQAGKTDTPKHEEDAAAPML